MTQHVTFAVAAVSKFLSTDITLKFNKELSLTYFRQLRPFICICDFRFRWQWTSVLQFRSLEGGTNNSKSSDKTEV